MFVLLELSLVLFANLLVFPSKTSAASIFSGTSLGGSTSQNEATPESDKTLFIESLLSKMMVQDLVLQLHLMFGDDIVGKNSDNARYDEAMSFSPSSPVGNIHDWYPMNKSRYNGLQRLNSDKARLNIPFMHFAECLHGVASYNQSMFPQAIAMAATFDVDLVHRVGRAIGTEARSIGIHACLAPVLDLGKDPRFGRVQEAWGEDKVLTSHMGVAFASGLSKNGSWAEPDAVVPVVKKLIETQHFAAYGAPQSGINAAPWMGHGNREVLGELLTPFKAVLELGGARGVMMSYNEVDDVPAHVSPMLYEALSSWGFDGFIISDDAALEMLHERHFVSKNSNDSLQQWLNAGGMIQYYDYSLENFGEIIVDSVQNDTVPIETLVSDVRRILGVKYDLGLFSNPYIPDDIDPYSLTTEHVPLTLEAAQKSIVLLENRNQTLPLHLKQTQKLAIIGPFVDTLNYGDYSGTFGAYPIANAVTLRQGVLANLERKRLDVEVVSNWGANSWVYNAQYPIPGYLLSTNGTSGGLQATYFADTEFQESVVTKKEIPVLNWGLYPPPGLPSNNFSVIWEGQLQVPVDGDIEGWLGVAVSPNTTAKLFVDGELFSNSSQSKDGNILSNIPTNLDNTAAPPGSSPLLFRSGAQHSIRIEYQAYNNFEKIANQNSINAEVILFWNLVDSSSPVDKAVTTAASADVVVLSVGSAWNSDGEGGDRGTLGLSPNQTTLADAIFALGKPVVLVLQGGRPFAIPEYYNKSSAVLTAFFPGQMGGQAIADVLFGEANPGGRVSLSVPAQTGQLPVYYNYKKTAHNVTYVDIDWRPTYPFGYGLSYTSFEVVSFKAASSSATLSDDGASSSTFTSGDAITFSVGVKNTGSLAGSYVAQVYLLQRVSQITQPVKQLVAFQRVYLEAGESRTVDMDLEVDRFLPILNRKFVLELEKGEYVFALLEHGGSTADQSLNLTMVSV
ncbi:glycoside hydrolase family 3 protein [Phyllosticta citriasiana]|uniref:xylan 1,4-beta-xylosidase n=1 Tax=Phyllosticta citriasiana TaxID=595635 RepID=A0ABR1KKR4_9PEZI